MVRDYEGVLSKEGDVVSEFIRAKAELAIAFLEDSSCNADI
jgi:hypothetical protein